MNETPRIPLSEKDLLSNASSNPGPKHKLALKHQRYVCASLAVGFNPTVTADLLKENFGIEVSRENIYQEYLHGRKWKVRIARYRKMFDRKTLKHPLASKTIRLEIVSKAINEALTWRLDKINYDKQGNEVSRVEKRNVGAIASLVREARNEIEGPAPLIDMSKHDHFVKIFLPEQKTDGVETPTQATRIP